MNPPRAFTPGFRNRKYEESEPPSRQGRVWPGNPKDLVLRSGRWVLSDVDDDVVVETLN